MTDFIKPLLGIVITLIGASVVLFGVGFAAQMSLLGFIGMIIFLFLGAGICEVGYIIVISGDIHESFLFKFFACFTTKQ